MQRVQTGGYLHGLYLIHRLAGGIECTAQLQWWTTIGISILTNEILHLLSIHKRSCKSMFFGDDGFVVLKAILCQHRLHLLMRTWSNLIYHRPRVCNLAAIVDIIQKTSLYDAILHPALSISLHTSLYMIAIVRTVVSRLKGDR